MARHDWNQDGKRDATDDYIEYQIYKNVTEKEESNLGTSSSNNSSNRSNNTSKKKEDISTAGAMLSAIVGFILLAFIYMLIGDDADIPSPVLQILWLVITFVIIRVVIAIKKSG